MPSLSYVGTDIAPTSGMVQSPLHGDGSRWTARYGRLEKHACDPRMPRPTTAWVTRNGLDFVWIAQASRIGCTQRQAWRQAHRALLFLLFFSLAVQLAKRGDDRDRRINTPLPIDRPDNSGVKVFSGVGPKRNLWADSEPCGRAIVNGRPDGP